jgi:hypothetical protein
MLVAEEDAARAVVVERAEVEPAVAGGVRDARIAEPAGVDR